jgi:aryl-alcohol dehydrogenase-like predicted oxidoreductase
MEYKKLDITELNISRLCFGCWAIGGHGWGNIDDEDSIRAIKTARDLGINFFDTADCYGFGHSEEILSKALGNDRNKVVIATKVGVTWNKAKQIGRNLSHDYIVKALEDSLRRLRIDSIPLYQIHWPDVNTPIEDTINTLKKCQESGKIQYYGCSNFSYRLVKNAQKYGNISTIQLPYNLIKREFENEIPVYNNDLHMAVMVYDTLAKGLLTGKFNVGSIFDLNDVRRRDENYQGEKFKKNLLFVETLRKIGVKYNKSCSHVALRWLLDNSNITAVIVGIKKSGQIIENTGSLDWTLEKCDYDLLSEHKVI